MPDSHNDTVKLIAADTLARLVVYGPLAVGAAMFAPPALIVIGLAASQPWLGEGIGMAVTWLEKRYPDVMAPVDELLSRYAGMQWWKHLGVLITALAVAIVPAPAIAAHLPHLVQTGLNLLGGVNQTWTQYVLPFALVTALPFATTLATNGFEWVFQKIPALRDASIRRQQKRDERGAERQAIRSAIRQRVLGDRAGTPAPSPESPAVAAPPSAGHPPATISETSAKPEIRAMTIRTMAAPATLVMAPPSPPKPGPAVRRVVAPVHERVIRGRSRLMPEVIRLATPPRFDAPRPDRRHLGDVGL